MSLHYLGMHEPQKMLYTINDIALACYIFNTNEPMLIIVDGK